jgi:hypothetical protein
MVTISYGEGTVVFMRAEAQPRCKTASSNEYIAPSHFPAIWMMPSGEGSGDVLPYHHPAWHDLEALFARLDALDDVDDDLDDTWLRNLRRDTRLRTLYATDDRE